jgi:hypothetical protein
LSCASVGLGVLENGEVKALFMMLVKVKCMMDGFGSAASRRNGLLCVLRHKDQNLELTESRYDEIDECVD